MEDFCLNIAALSHALLTADDSNHCGRKKKCRGNWIQRDVGIIPLLSNIARYGELNRDSKKMRYQGEAVKYCSNNRLDL